MLKKDLIEISVNKFYYIFFILIIGCSLNSNSTFWSKSEKVKTDKDVTKILFKDVKPNEEEFNPKLIVNLPKGNIIMMVLQKKKFLMKMFPNIIFLKLKIFQAMSQKS